MNPQGHVPTTPNYSDSALSVYQQPHNIPSTVTHTPHQQQQQAQGDYNVRSDQVQYIATPPLVRPGVFQNPNPSPFTTTPRTAVQNVSPPPPVRYLCDKCGATFSRSHDRNRHFETTHSDNPPVHKCERCRKQFSRADAKRRHQADGKCVSSS